jgi:hypothetical protein
MIYGRIILVKKKTGFVLNAPFAIATESLGIGEYIAKMRLKDLRLINIRICLIRAYP